MSVFTKVLQHPFNRSRRLRALGRLLWWQLVAPRNGEARQFGLIDRIRMYVRRGETAVTACYYCGLFEYREMLFLLRCLRDADVFIDVGANSGVYTLLGASTGARVIAIEPGSRAHDRLLKNLRLNQIDRADVYCAAVSSAPGQATLTTGLDATNYLTIDTQQPAEAVRVLTLDSLQLPAGAWRVCKIDVEGHEESVLRGAVDFLAAPELAAVIIEAGGSGTASGGRLHSIHNMLTAAGFNLVDYDPDENQLAPAAIDAVAVDKTVNLIYIRSRQWCNSRLANARQFQVQGRTV
ncbi:MAG: FkbM family methyltransferase [Gammaproteobacteria bacterium]|nr:FkbM family methyltransferase [Gammaproteobacteria bacterium]NND59650.1 FkbM family methyltransferase [Gammaproteobacteria bacterium]